MHTNGKIGKLTYGQMNRKKNSVKKKRLIIREIVRKEGRYKEECVIKYIFKNLKINICAPLNFENLLSLKEIIAQFEI